MYLCKKLHTAQKFHRICAADILDRRTQEHIYHADGTDERRILCSYEKNVAHRKHGMTQNFVLLLICNQQIKQISLISVLHSEPFNLCNHVDR